MKLKTLKDLPLLEQEIRIVKEEAIKHLMEVLKHNKNPFRAWLYFMDLTEEDLL